jgi:formimidoylglutamate deiminase
MSSAAESGQPVSLVFERALLGSDIARHVALRVAADGTIEQAQAGHRCDRSRIVPGLALPGMPNLHSHAFQRGMAGSAEVLAREAGSFWGWREVMYRFVARLEPEDVEAIATFLYMEMLEAGYTSVAEFHYVHHQPGGTPYLDAVTMSHAVRSAAARAGIRQLLLPCLYQSAGFGALPLQAEQRRFGHDAAAFLRLFHTLQGQSTPRLSTGIALHSLRAVPETALREIVAAVAATTPIHIHISEQRREVEECLAFTGHRPLDFLAATVPLDARWCLVHATHASAQELSGIARSGAIVGLCPTTEANLGDGRFPLDEFVHQGGRFGIGSDSQVSIDPREELRTAEYALRMHRERRALIASTSQPHCGSFLYGAAVDGGAQAIGLAGGELKPGAPADIVVVDTDSAAFAGVPEAALLDAYVFAPRPGAVRDVMVDGRWLVRNGLHPQRESIEQAYRACLQRLAATTVAPT